jgi:hypothetical protein
MTKLRFKFVGSDSFRDFTVDERTAEQATSRLNDVDAVLTFTDENRTTYIPVRNITYVTAEPR